MGLNFWTDVLITRELRRGCLSGLTRALWFSWVEQDQLSSCCGASARTAVKMHTKIIWHRGSEMEETCWIIESLCLLSCQNPGNCISDQPCKQAATPHTAHLLHIPIMALHWNPHILLNRECFSCALANIYLTNDLLLCSSTWIFDLFSQLPNLIWSSWRLPCSSRLPRPKKYCAAFVYYQLHTPVASADHGCDHNWRRAVRHCYGALPQAQTWFQ
jgi:hypothetical protein